MTTEIWVAALTFAGAIIALITAMVTRERWITHRWENPQPQAPSTSQPTTTQSEAPIQSTQPSVRVLEGEDGKGVRIGIEKGMVQVWIVPNVESQKGGWFAVVPKHLLQNGPNDGTFSGFNDRGSERMVTFRTSENKTVVRVHTPTNSSGEKTTVNAKELDAAIRHFASI